MLVVNLPASARDIRDMGSICGLERSPGGGHGNLLQYSCLENPVDRGACWATVHGVSESGRTEPLSTRCAQTLKHIVYLVFLEDVVVVKSLSHV